MDARKIRYNDVMLLKGLWCKSPIFGDIGIKCILGQLMAQ